MSEENKVSGSNAEEIRKRYVEKKRAAAVNNQMLNEYHYLRNREVANDGLYQICEGVMREQGEGGLLKLIQISNAMLSHIRNGKGLV